MTLPPFGTTVEGDLCELTASGATSLLQLGAISALEYAEAHLKRIDRAAAINAFIHLDREHIQVQARRADARSAQERRSRPLHGLLVAVKDNIDVADMPCTAGTPALRGNQPVRNAPVVERLIQAGAIIVGKANMHELGHGVTNNNVVFGPVRNPYAPSHIPGGSSGGTAAAVAGRLATLGLGTDTGGSVRIPAAHCGIVGFRPSSGRWPNEGVVPISPTRDTIGPMARTVGDCALLDTVICGTSGALENARLDRLRIGLPRRQLWASVAPEIAAMAEELVSTLRKSGVHFVDVELGFDLAQCSRSGVTIARAENLGALRNYAHSRCLHLDLDEFVRNIATPQVRQLLNQLAKGAGPTLQEYEQALNQRREIQQAYSSLFAIEQLDALMLPSTPQPPALIGQDDFFMSNGTLLPTFETYVQNAAPSSVAGLPSISLPLGKLKGLPLGIQFDGPIGSDRMLLALAAAIEEVLPRLTAPCLLSLPAHLDHEC